MNGIENSVLIWVAVSAILGLAAGIVWPYANAWLRIDGPLPFSGRMVTGRVIGGITAFALSATTLSQLQGFVVTVNENGWIGYVLAFLTVFAGAYGGREVQKTPGSVGAALERRKNGE